MTDLSARIANLSPEKRAMLTRRLQQDSVSSAQSAEPLAIVGMGCRLPGGVDTPAKFWELLAQGVDAISEVPADRWDIDAYYDPDPSSAGKIAARCGGFIDGIDRFDAALFQISPREAGQMDPQQRVLLEVAWQALENAGQAPDQLAGTRTGVFVGVHSHSNDYCWLQFSRPELLDGFSGTGSAHNFLSGRLSYVLDLKGPSLVVDTACSSSLVATHLAVQSLRARECSTAIVGGINVMLTPLFSVAASRMHMLAPDGRCKPFDAAADGFTRGEGCGVVVMKRLADAVASGDRVLAVLRGSAINQDGHTNGITAPNGLSQQSVIREALRNGGVEPHLVGYVEAHGTGTPLGDPIEVEALAAVFGEATGHHRVFLGSAKSNIGHLEGAAGVIGLIKAVLTLQHRQVPPVVHFRQLNPHISLDRTPLVIPDALQPWVKADGPRIAGVSAFGWSGTNAHVVLEEAPAASDSQATAPEDRDRLIALSAHTADALDSLVREWTSMLSDAPAPCLAALASTAGLRRSHHAHRLAVVAGSCSTLKDSLHAYLARESRPAVVAAEVIPRRSGVVFVFPGQGSQWLGMGRQLLASDAIFRDAIERCEQAFTTEVHWSLIGQLTAEANGSRLHEIEVIQPALFAIEVALAALWRSWGIEPDAVVGHSMGEVAAAHVAGALSLEDAARIICRRSRLLKRISGQGAMAVVELSLEEAAAAIAGHEGRLSIAVSNSPRSTVLSGDVSAVDEVVAALQARDVFCRPIKVDVASHSPQVDALKGDLLRELADIRPRAASVPIYSTVTTRSTDGAEFDASYWVRNLREPVLLSTVVQSLAADGLTTFIEVSPHPILLPAIETGLQQLERPGIVVPSLRREEPERAVMLASLGRLHVAGYVVNWAAQATGVSAFVELPATPFQRERFWLSDAAAQRPASRPDREGHPFLGAATLGPAGSVAWNATPDSAGVPAFAECRLAGRQMMAPAIGLEAALEAARVVGARAVKGFEFERPMLDPGTGRLVARANAQLEAGGSFGFRIVAQEDGGPWITHATAVLARQLPHLSPSAIDVEAVGARCREVVSGPEAYDALARAGWHIGNSLRVVTELRTGHRELVARLDSDSSSRGRGFQLAPAVAQACLDVAAMAAARSVERSTDDLFVPLRIGEIVLERFGEAAEWIVARTAEPDAATDATATDIALLDGDGKVIARLTGIECVRLAADARDLAAQRLDEWLHQIDWQAVGPLAPVLDAGRVPGRWLVFADRTGVGDAVVDTLSRRGETVVVLRRGEFGDVGTAVTEILARGERPCRGLIHLWSLDLPGLDTVDQATLEGELLANSGSVLSAVQALTAGSAADEGVRLWIATRGAQPVGGAMTSHGPLQAPLWGLGRVIAEEHLECWGGLVDLDPAGQAAPTAELLLRQIEAQDGERQVAFREGTRYGARFVPLSAAPSATAMVRLRPDATYAVTGGLNGVGLAVARWLVEQGARHLVLIGRTSLPVRRAWSSADPSSQVGQRIEAVRTLEALGATVHAPALDISDAAALQGFWDTFHAEGWPAIRGIVHAAVVIEDGLLRGLSAASFATVMRPKVAGAWLLHRVTEGAALDFFVLFSSLGAVLGQTGQANYAAANAFLDALAHYRKSRGLPGLSINWAGWREAGLGTASAGARRTIKNLEAEGIASYTTAQGLDVFGRVLQCAEAQAIVMPFSRTRIRRSHWATADPHLFEAMLQKTGADQEPPPVTVSFRQQLSEAEPERRRAMFEEFLSQQLAQVLRLPASKIDPARPMGALGLESLMALEFRNRLESHLGLRLSATVVWNHPTVIALAQHLAERLGVSLDAGRTTAEAASGMTGALELDSLSELDALRALTGGMGEA